MGLPMMGKAIKKSSQNNQQNCHCANPATKTAKAKTAKKAIAKKS